jgi:L-fuconolactonase
MRIDAHQHFWELGRFDYPWMPPEPSPLRHDFLPDHLGPILERNRFDGSVVVQAATSLAETEWLLELAVQHAFIRGVVGWVDLTDPRLGDTLDRLQAHPRFKGVRHPAHDEPTPNWLLREDVLRGLTELARRDLPFDLLIRPVALPLVPLLAERVPGLRMVINHIAKPPIACGQIAGWAQDIEIVSQIPTVYCKISGMITEADWNSWTVEDLRPYVRHVFAYFGPERLMFGSDWPVCLLACEKWKEVLAAFTQATGALTVELREQILGETARWFYKL